MASDIANTNISAHTITQIQIYMLLFAYDTVLFAESQTYMQALLDKLYQYCCKWNISVNIDKTKTLVFKSGNRHENVVLRYAGSLLTNVKSFTYLGLTLSSNGKFYQAQKALAEQATKALFSFNKLFEKKNQHFYSRETEIFRFNDTSYFELRVRSLGFSFWSRHRKGTSKVFKTNTES